MVENTKPRIGIALGSGSARGWTHIGVLRALEEMGIKPDVITGASVGSLVAASMASNQLDDLQDWALSLSKFDVWRLLDASFGKGGFISGDRLMNAIGQQLVDENIEDLSIKFGAVAADLYSGKEVWLKKGPMLDAVRASSGLPGLFTPMLYQNQWLIDGGVVNPVPVSMCRGLGAEFVIAVNLNETLIQKKSSDNAELPEHALTERLSDSTDNMQRWSEKLHHMIQTINPENSDDEPSMIEVMFNTISIMQEHITHARMASDPPEVIIKPELGHFNIMDFHLAEEAIGIGMNAVKAVEHKLPTQNH